MTDEQTDPKDAPIDHDAQGGSDDLQPGSGRPLKADQEEPDIEPFAGDDDILSGHLGSPDQR